MLGRRGQQAKAVRAGNRLLCLNIPQKLYRKVTIKEKNMSKQAVINTIAGILGTAVLAGGIVMAVPKTRNAIMDGIAKNSTIYQSAIENNSKLEQDYKSKSDRVSELETIQANLKLEIEKVKNDAKLNDEEKSAKIADLQKQIEYLNQRIQKAEGLNNASVHLSSLVCLLILDSSNNEILGFSKHVNDGVDDYDKCITTGDVLAKLADAHFGSVEKDDDYNAKIPSMPDLTFFTNVRWSFDQSSDMRVPTTYNVEIVDENNNAFDFANVKSDLSYNFQAQRFEYTCYSIDELVGTNYENDPGILKTVDVKVVVSVA